MAALDACMSDYRVDSELNRVSDGAGGPPVPVSEDLIDVLEAGIDAARESRGAFDPTVGPCVTLWRASRRGGALPPAEVLANAVGLVGWRGLDLDRRAGTVRLNRAGMRLDLGGIAKGYAADRAVRLLRSKGFGRCLVALAGDVAVGDPPPDQPGWRVAVAGCDASATVGTLWLKNAAVSTSGGCEQFVEIAGVRYAHIVDPRTGLGSRQNHVVTVVAKRGEFADSLSTAAFLLGPEQSREMIRGRAGTAAVFSPAATGGGPVAILDESGILRWERPPPGP